jgi:Spy/CpxP family protein refolding chaperone
MKNLTSKNIVLVLATIAFAFTAAYAHPPAPGAAQTPPGVGAAAAQGGRGGRGGGLPGATAEQNQAVMDMIAALAPLSANATTARNELATAMFASPINQGGVRAALDRYRAAELALASARAEAFARLQAGPNKLNPEHVTALIANGGNLQGGRGGGGRGRGN